MLPAFPDQPPAEELTVFDVARTLREYADMLETCAGRIDPVAFVAVVLNNDGIAETWMRAFPGAKERLGEVLTDMGESLTSQGDLGSNEQPQGRLN